MRNNLGRKPSVVCHLSCPVREMVRILPLVWALVLPGLLLTVPGCTTYEVGLTHSETRPAFQVGECFQFTTSNHTDMHGKVLAVKDASYYVEVEANNAHALKYADIIPISRLHRLAIRVPC